MRVPARLRAALGLSLLTGCPSDDSTTGDTIADTTASDTTDTSDTEPAPSEGLFACPTGEACTFVVVAQAFDDRVEVFAARGPGPVYRGAIDLDLKPNPMGDNSGDFLDEPFGLTVDSGGLSVLVGHYPARDHGSLLRFPHEMLAAQTVGTTVPVSTFFDGAAFVAPVSAIDMAAEEAIFMLTHPSGRQLVGVFANDLFALETEWTNPGELLVVDPATGEVGRRSLADIGVGCPGAWSLVPLDDAMDTVALACDGNDGAVVLDVSGVGQGSVADAAAAIGGCYADVFFPNNRVRQLAPDGLGGFLLAENEPNATLESGRLWRFEGLAGDCEMLGTTPGDIPGELFEVRQIVPVPSDDGARWLMATGLIAPGRGVHVVRDGAEGAEICAKLDELDTWWTATDGSDVHPYAMAIDRAGTGLAIGAGPPQPADTEPGYGRVLWVELGSGDPCEASPVQNVIDLSAEAPAVSPDDPSTWSRGPNVVVIKEYG
jgi:hypothetical protein